MAHVIFNMSGSELSQVYNEYSSSDINIIEYNRFIWDAVFSYFSPLAIIFAVLGLGEEIFLDRGLACNAPRYVDRDQYAYVVLWCSRHVLRVDLLPSLIVLHTFFVVTPQLVWEVYAAPSLQQFFSLTPGIEHLREKKVGTYNEDTSAVVQYLRDNYRHKTGLLRSYRYKIIFQTVVSWIAFVGMLGTYEGGVAFTVDFNCSRVGLVGETERSNVSTNDGLDPFDALCSYTSSSFFFALWIADMILLLLTAGVAIFGLVWLKQSHWEELDYKGRADFYYSFSMNSGNYNPSHSQKTKSTIKDDFDFLTLLLFNSDKGLGETLYNVQVELHLQERWADDYESYTNYVSQFINSPNQDETIMDELDKLADRVTNAVEQPNQVNGPTCHLGDHLIYLCRGSGENESFKRPYILFKCALHLFCGSKGCTVALARLSRETFAVDFNPFYSTSSNLEMVSAKHAADSKKFIIEETFRNIYHMRVPSDITSKTGKESEQLRKRLTKTTASLPEGEKTEPLKYDLIVITSLEPHFRASTVKVIMEAMFPDSLMDGCFIVVYSKSKSSRDNIMNNLMQYCDDDTVLKDDHEFDINGQRVRVWYRVNRFNEDKCKQLYSTS